jgi:hypothetical protein
MVYPFEKHTCEYRTSPRRKCGKPVTRVLKSHGTGDVVYLCPKHSDVMEKKFGLKTRLVGYRG